MFLCSHHWFNGGVPITASTPVAYPAVATAGAISPGEVASLAHQLSPGLSCTPQL